MKRLLMILMLIGSASAWSDGTVDIGKYADPEYIDWHVDSVQYGNEGSDKYRLCELAEIYTQACTISRYCQPGECANEWRLKWNIEAEYQIKHHEWRCTQYGDNSACKEVSTYQDRVILWRNVQVDYQACMDASSGVALIKRACRAARSESYDVYREKWGINQ